ncbi:MAG: hypothetical protein RBT73_09225 [Spirochaetia bacterium]|jgi:hypothetical protein|nr:hypothetical protein [Spirochaetia bacterium]
MIRPKLQKTITLQAFLMLVCAAFLSLFFSCGVKSVTSFAWSSPAGKALAFTQTENFQEGRENLFGPGREINSYRLGEALAAPEGFMLAAEISAVRDDLVLGFSLGAESKKMGEELRFAAPKGKLLFYLSLPAGQSLRVLRLSVSVSSNGNPGTTGGAEDREGVGEEWARLVSLALLPAFRGFEEHDNGYRISDGISIKKQGQSARLLTIQNPFAPTGDKGNPVLVLRYSERAEADIVIEAGTRVLARTMSAKREIRIPASAFDGAETLSNIRITVPDGVGLGSAFVESASGVSAHLTDPGSLLMGGGPGEGEEYRWFRWDLLPSVIMFDFKTYDIQDAYLKRLAFFVEKKGFVGRLASNQEIAPLHGWNAHDYKAEDLARFFALAEKQGFPLNPEELRLRDFLLEQSLIYKKGGGYGFAEEGVIISISRESPDYLRRTFLTHELSHGIFFADSRYRKFCTDLWTGMPAEEQWFWKLYFGWMNYNTASSYLMANEIQAYLVQQPPGRAEEYFTKTLVGRLLENHPELEEEIALYMEEYSPSFEARARMLDAWLRSNYGFGAGLAYFFRVPRTLL